MNVEGIVTAAHIKPVSEQGSDEIHQKIEIWLQNHIPA